MKYSRLSAKVIAAAMVTTAILGAGVQQAAAQANGARANGNALQDLKTLPKSETARQAYYKRYFSEPNSCGDHEPGSMPAKRICAWNPNNEDYPDLMVAVEQGKGGPVITSAVVLGDKGKQPLGAGWQCQMTTYGPSRICFPKGTPAAKQKKAASQWNRYLNAAG